MMISQLTPESAAKAYKGGRTVLIGYSANRVSHYRRTCLAPELSYAANEVIDSYRIAADLNASGVTQIPEKNLAHDGVLKYFVEIRN